MKSQPPTEIEQRERILQATAACIAEHGIDGATIRLVAKQAGVSVGMVQYYFPTKKELIAATHLSAVQEVRRLADALAGSERGPQRVEAMFRALLTDQEGSIPPWSFWLWYWAEATIEPDLRIQHEERFRLTREILAESIRLGIEHGEFREDLDPLLAADLAFSLLNGLAIEVTIAEHIMPAERALRAAELLLRVFAKSDTAVEAAGARVVKASR